MSEKIRNSSLAKIGGLAARICVVVSLYYLISRKFDLADLKPLLTPAFAWALAFAVLLNAGQAVICTYRWVALARKAKNIPPAFKSIEAYFEGLFFNQALPSFVGGDAVRILRWRSYGVRLHDATVSVVRDRMFGAIGAALFAFVACAQLWVLPVERYKTFVALLLGAAAFCAGVGLLLVMQSRRVTRLFHSFPRVHARLHQISAAPLGSRIYLEALAYSLAGQALSGLSVLVLARSLGIDLSGLLLVTATGIILVMSMIPISLAGWGIREAGFLAILAPLGVDHERIVMLGISFGMAGLLSAMLGGVSLLVGFNARRSEKSR